ncbi:D-galacturonic acid reductase [Dichomitus squalens]|uniref:D-galacturonic acid reductase n=1 Tax=Dichomitus squalens TaxID=114155 RepID=A0A4V2K5H6_9APHY|nr:D-galacturonic acid reductase [Dichomitus squalens LYAD-421 SS1]EJF66619.1 D-galacturonic acid reductase [Dichomitus squalens LYAD-421 SS1]TBU35156.1 D-galacturonic acid reductase [Dichomitus squalens]TBU48393.1 D-galacturonic acid reductase [Dichomitus squalens]TBU64977.1 D-galacturonic acid reductase [Dichomitus squalens]
MSELKKLNVLMCGTGEYTTGWTGAGASKSDKKIGVVALTCFDLRRLGKLDRLSMVGVNGGKFPAIRKHLQENIGNVYKDLDVSFDAYPEGDSVNAEAYKEAIDKLSPGDAVIIFTPDSTHYPIALYAIEHGLHVLVTKPAVQLLQHHSELVAAAQKKGVVCFVEHHKRFDPVYSDARARAATLGEFNFFSAWMSQPKSQLETFRAWAGKDSDISYYLSSHHIDIHCWFMQGRAVPTRVTASAATGIATSEPFNCVPQTEDTITLLVDWQSLSSSKHKGTAVYTASWTAPLKSGVHTSQHFYYMAEKGEINVDQAHRGYDIVNDETGKAWYNPFYMKYSPSESGHFDGQRGYGYVSIEKFIDAARSVNAGQTTAAEYDKHGLPTIANTILTTAILHAGRISLDEKRSVGIKQNGNDWVLE